MCQVWRLAYHTKSHTAKNNHKTQGPVDVILLEIFITKKHDKVNHDFSVFPTPNTTNKHVRVRSRPIARDRLHHARCAVDVPLRDLGGKGLRNIPDRYSDQRERTRGLNTGRILCLLWTNKLD